MDLLRTRGSAEMLLVSKEMSASSSPHIATRGLPDELREEVASGLVSHARIETDGVPYLVVGGPVTGSAVDAYHYVSQARLYRESDALGMILVTGWFAVVAVAALVGRSLARRTLRPVAEASRAARSVATGLLATRIPVERDDEFGTWAVSFNRMAEALEDKMEALVEAGERERRFVADVAHELRTPLASVVGAASFVADERSRPPPGPSRRALELLLQQVRGLNDLVEELLEISRLEAEQTSSVVEPVSLPALLADLASRPGWNGVRVFGDDLVLTTDPRLIERVIVNLVDNALRHGSADVELRVARENGFATVDVLDYGPGIPEDSVSHVFERFYKVDPSRAGKGSGLGLAIAKRNADILGATIEVSMRPGGGAQFTFRIPLTEGGIDMVDVACSPDR